MRRRRLLAAVAAGALAGCNGRGSATTSTPDTTASAPGVDGLSDDGAYGFTFVRPSGNRYLPGQGRVPEVDPVDVDLPSGATWVAAAPDRGTGTVVFATVLADGRVRAHRLDGCEVDPVEPFSSYGEGPPLLVINQGQARLTRSGTVFTHPTPIPGGSAVIRTDGGLALPGGELDVDPIADARIVTDGRLVYLLGDATTYRHGAVGDEVEGGAVMVVDPETRSVRPLVPPYGVIEGLSPMLTELGGELSVLVTASDGDRGASLALLRDDGSEGGTVVATSDPVGIGFGWRHQIAVAPFGPDGELEVASVRTPHRSAEAEFHRLDGSRLERVASTGSYPSHGFGSRNLDRAAAADFDGDGRPELLVPTPETGVLAALRRTADGLVEPWRLDVGGTFTTNLAVSPGPDGVVVGAGTPDGLRIWPAASQ